jgi:hypothetical protein
MIVVKYLAEGLNLVRFEDAGRCGELDESRAVGGNGVSDHGDR